VSQLAAISVVLIAGLIAAAIALRIFDSNNRRPITQAPKKHTRLITPVDPSFLTTVDQTQNADASTATVNRPIQGGRGFTSAP